KGGSPQQFGYLLTNYHVMKAALEAEIRLSNGSKGSIVGIVREDERADLALVTVLYTDSPTRLLLAKSNPSVGARVYAIGSPLGLDSSISEGIVSGFREIKAGVTWLQTTAPTSPGSSGGALVTPDGQVVGITTGGRDDGQN